LYDGVDLIRRVYELGASIEILDKPHLGLDTAIGRAIVALLSGLAEDERLRIRRRTEMGRVAAKVRGVVFGRPEKLSGYQIDCAREMRCGGKSYREIGRVLGVHHSTVSSMLEVA
jgi:DNA invertase Pin-like site-specific DNA recombinase